MLGSLHYGTANAGADPLATRRYRWRCHMATGWSPTSMPRREAQFALLYPDLSRSAREMEAAEEFAAREEA